MSKNKEKTSNSIVNKAVADLNKKYGAGSINRLGDMGGAQAIPKFSSGIAHLDLALGGGWPVGRMIEVYGNQGAGKCLTEDANILTPTGYKTIKEIFNENGLETSCVNKVVDVKYPLINKDGEVEYTTHFVFNNRKPVNKITTKTGSVIKCTDMHPICVINEHGFMAWKYSKDITAGDYLVGRKGGSYSSNKKLVTEDEALLLGMMTADAYFGDSKITFTNNSPEVKEFYENNLLKIDEFVGLKINKYQQPDYNVSGSMEYHINSKDNIPKFYDRVGITNGIARDKMVPKSILDSNIDIQKIFLKGYFDCECELNDSDKEIVTTSTSYNLLKTVQIMLKNIGITSFLNEKIVKNYENNKHWKLGIYSTNVDKFVSEIGFVSKEKLDKINSSINRTEVVVSSEIPNTSICQSLDKKDKESAIGNWYYSAKERNGKVITNKLKSLLEIESQNKELRNLLLSYPSENLYFDEVIATERLDGVPTFDFSMERTHTFIAEGIINHNTSVVLFALAHLQKMGKKVAFIDLENALDPTLAQMYGVDTDDLYLAYPMTGEAAFGIIEGLASTGEFGAIALDSVSAILPSAEREEDIGKQFMALQARLMSQVLRRLVGVCGKTGTTIFFINQIREKMVMYGCLHADTLINFVDGRSLPIRQVVENKIEGEVWSYNENTKLYEPKRIIDWHHNGEVESSDDFIHIQTESIDGDGRFEFTVTPDHLVLTDDSWVKAKDITLSSMIASNTVQDFVSVKEIRDASESQMKQKGKYDISIEDNHNYVVGGINNGIVVHNSPNTTSGGRALPFYASVRAEVRIDEFIGENGKSQKSRDGAIGHKTKVKIVKNKVAKPFEEGYYSLIYGEGFDKYYDIFNMAVHTGVVNKGGAWYSYKDFKWQGGDNVLTEWKNNPLLFDEIAEKTYSAIQAESQGKDAEETDTEITSDAEETNAEITSDEDNVEEK